MCGEQARILPTRGASVSTAKNSTIYMIVAWLLKLHISRLLEGTGFVLCNLLVLQVLYVVQGVACACWVE